MRPNNHIILDKIAFFLLLSLTLMITTCKSTGERTTEGQGKIDKLEIRGFTQFPVYTGRNFLGYIEADGQEKTFDKKLWRGDRKSVV